jgi:hypothetical protein
MQVSSFSRGLDEAGKTINVMASSVVSTGEGCTVQTCVCQIMISISWYSEENLFVEFLEKCATINIQRCVQTLRKFKQRFITLQIPPSRPRYGCTPRTPFCGRRRRTVTQSAWRRSDAAARSCLWPPYSVSRRGGKEVLKKENLRKNNLNFVKEVPLIYSLCL